MQELTILCPYCNAQYTAEMKTTLSLCEGSYTPDCVSSKLQASINIHCKNCSKLVYKKEVEEYAPEEYDEARWNNN